MHKMSGGQISRGQLVLALLAVLSGSATCYEGEDSGVESRGSLTKCYQCSYSEVYGFLKPVDPSIRTGIQCKYGSLGKDSTEDCTQLSTRSGDEYVCGSIKGELKGSKFYLRGCHPKSKVKGSYEDFPGPDTCTTESIAKRWDYIQRIYGRGIGQPPNDPNNMVKTCFCDDKDFCNGAVNPRLPAYLIVVTVTLRVAVPFIGFC